MMRHMDIPPPRTVWIVKEFKSVSEVNEWLKTVRVWGDLKLTTNGSELIATAKVVDE